MKLIIVATTFFIISNNIYGQTIYSFDELKEGYENLDIQYVSGNVLYMINAEMKRADSIQYKKFIGDKRDAIYVKYNFGDTDKQKAYLDNYNSELKRIRNIILANDILMQVKPKVIQEYAIPALNRYGSNYASPFLSGLIQPAMKGKMAEFTIQKICESANDVLNSQQHNLDSLTILLIQYWKNAGVTLDQMQQSGGTVKDSILQLIKNIPAPDSIQTFLLQSAAPLAERVKQQLNGQWNNAITHVNNQQAEIRKKFINTYQVYTLSVKSETEEKFRVIGESFEVLVKNEKTVYNTLDKIQKDWAADTARISSLENKIRQGGNNVTTYIQQHTELVAQNFFRLEIISEYANKGKEFYDFTLKLKAKVYDKIVDPAQREEFMQSLSLDKLTKLPTLSDALASVSGFANQVRELFGDCKEIQDVAQFAKYAMSAVNIGIGVTELISFNPMGLVNIFSGLSGLFGNNTKPEPSPEMKMMQQMMNYMSKNFERIDKRLDTIEQKIDNLTNITIDMYKDMMKSFAVIGDKLDRIDRELDAMDIMERYEILKNYNSCPILFKPYDVKQNSEHDFPKYFNDIKNWINNSPAGNNCINAIELNSPLANALIFSTEKCSAKNFNVADLQLNNIYNPTLDLFGMINHYNAKGATNALFIPSKKIESNKILWFSIMNDSSLNLLNNSNSALNEYYNYRMVSNMAQYLLKLCVYFEISEQSHIISLTDFLSEDTSAKNYRFAFIDEGLETSLSMINQALIQQSLLAGNTMIPISQAYLSNNSCSNCDDIVEKLKVVLYNNKLFAKNYASLLVYDVLKKVSTQGFEKTSQRFTELYYSVSSTKVDSLNMEFPLQNAKFSYSDNKEINITLNIKGKKIQIPLPPPSFIISNEMAQSDGLFMLLDVKEKVIDKLIDNEFFKLFQPVNGLNTDDYKYLIQDIDN